MNYIRCKIGIIPEDEYIENECGCILAKSNNVFDLIMAGDRAIYIDFAGYEYEEEIEYPDTIFPSTNLIRIETPTNDIIIYDDLNKRWTI